MYSEPDNDNEYKGRPFDSERNGTNSEVDNVKLDGYKEKIITLSIKTKPGDNSSVRIVISFDEQNPNGMSRGTTPKPEQSVGHNGTVDCNWTVRTSSAQRLLHYLQYSTEEVREAKLPTKTQPMQLPMEKCDFTFT